MDKTQEENNRQGGQNIIVSVLVAVYNTEHYLRKCLDSLCNQTLADFEAICVDDGSTDGSRAVLEQYTQTDHRIKLIGLDRNMGPSHARNLALEKARGKLICFLDSDDWLSEDALEKAVETMEKDPQTDCVLFRCLNYYGFTDSNHKETEPYPMDTFEMMTGKEAFKLSLTWKIHGIYMATSEIQRASPYDESRRAYSDDNTTRLHYLHSRHVRCCEGIYYYRQHAASLTHSVTPRRFDYMHANESMKKQLHDLHADKGILDIYEKVRWLVLVDTYMFYYQNRRKLPVQDTQKEMKELHRLWLTIETERLPMRLKFKFGYMPFRGKRGLFPHGLGWLLFRLQEEVYFFLRSLLYAHKGN